MFKKLIKKLNSINQTFVLFNKTNLHTKPDFTKNNYRINRGNYRTLKENHINFFRNLLGEERVIMDLCDLEKYNVDFLKFFRGASSIALKPKTTEEVSKILEFCNNNRLAICPQGGHTGVVGGGTAVFDEIVLSTDLMNNIISLDETSGILTCQSGCILQNLDNYVAQKGLTIPLDLGAKGSCHIGGNVSTNAGGIRLIKYGNLHGNVLGLEVVKANGEVLECLSKLKKDNTGYHLKHLFIGSEGTLGFITKVAIQCPPRPKSLHVAFLGCQTFEKVLKTFHKSRQELGEIISAFEVIDTPTMNLINEHLKIPSPIGNYPFYVLMETLGSNEEHDAAKLEKFLESSLLKHFILNGIVTSEPKKCNAIWEMREKIPEAYAKDGYVYLYDVSLPLENYYQLVLDMKQRMGNLSHRVFGFGHLGDSNLHVQVSVKEYNLDIKNHIEPYIFERTKELKGSISAEHGVGLGKVKYLSLMKSEAAINLMRQMKRIMDPNGILNPYKTIA